MPKSACEVPGSSLPTPSLSLLLASPLAFASFLLSLSSSLLHRSLVALRIAELTFARGARDRVTANSGTGSSLNRSLTAADGGLLVFLALSLPPALLPPAKSCTAACFCSAERSGPEEKGRGGRRWRSLGLLLVGAEAMRLDEERGTTCPGFSGA